MARLPNPETGARMRHQLLEWYERSKRDLPWRRTQDPYAIWVSEIMLQQTRVAAVIEKYAAFLERFPTMEALAAADEQDVLALWSGLGFTTVARACCTRPRRLSSQNTPERCLRRPKNCGSWRASAPTPPRLSPASRTARPPIAVVDGNVERVLSRIRGWESHDAIGEAAVRRKVEEFAAGLVDPRRPGDFNQAIMELGATVCTPRNPQCLVCPWAAGCRTLGEHKTPKRAAMTSREIACALVLRHGDAGRDSSGAARGDKHRDARHVGTAGGRYR